MKNNIQGTLTSRASEIQTPPTQQSEPLAQRFTTNPNQQQKTPANTLQTQNSLKITLQINCIPAKDQSFRYLPQTKLDQETPQTTTRAEAEKQHTRNKTVKTRDPPLELKSMDQKRSGSHHKLVKHDGNGVPLALPPPKLKAHDSRGDAHDARALNRRFGKYSLWSNQRVFHNK